MTDRNAMLQALYSTVVSQGEITGKAFLDYDLLDERRANAEDKTTMPNSYAGAHDDLNLWAMPGELVYGLKENRTEYLSGGGTSEVGVTTVSGLNHREYNSDRAMHDDHYLLGVCKTESRFTPDGMSMDGDSGFSFLRVGSISIVNNGPHIIYPGQKLRWRFPPNKDTPGGLAKFNRQGTPSGKQLLEVVPFDPTDFDMQLAGAYAAMNTEPVDYRGPGIKGVEMSKFFSRGYANDAADLSPLQQEALGYKFGWLGGLLCGALEVLVQADFITITDADAGQPSYTQVQNFAINTLRLFATTSNTQEERALNERGIQLQQQIMAAMLLQALPARDQYAVDARATFIAQSGTETYEELQKMLGRPGLSAERQYALMRANAPRLALGGITGTWNSMCNTSLGFSMSASAPGDTLHCVLGHCRPGI